MKIIKYIGFYNHHDSPTKRISHLSSVNKMNYVVECLNESGYQVEIISPSWITHDNNKFFVSSETKKIHQNKFRYAPSVKGKFGFQYLSIFISAMWLFFYLIFNTKKDEKIIVYHSLWLSAPVYYAQKIKRFQIVLEIEEIYGDIWNFKKILVRYEKRIIAISAAYLLASDLLKEKLDSRKNSILLYGAYAIKNQLELPINTAKTSVDVVYAGGIEKVRAGAFISVDIIERLPENYFLHILGFGSDEDVNELKAKIENSIAKERIKFHGSLKGEAFTDFLSKCDVGLNPQIVGKYMDSAFPSKILTYLNAGLNVISSKVESIYRSEISKNIFFYDELDDVKNFEVKAIDRDLIKNLHHSFKQNLKAILNDK